MSTNTFTTGPTQFTKSSVRISGTLGTSVQIDGTGPVATTINGVDAAGEPYGSYTDGSGTGHAFVVRNGVLVTTDFPGQSVQVNGVDPSGNPFGRYGGPGGFGFISSNGVATIISGPTGAVDASVLGVDAAGDIVGSYHVYNGTYLSATMYFIDRNGTYTQLAVSGATSFSVVGVAADGTIIGNTQGASFVDENGSVTFLPLPQGTQNTTITGVDVAGDYVGSYYNNGDHYFTGRNGSLIAVNGPPSSGKTFVSDVHIDGAGDLVGTTYDSTTGAFGGFVEKSGSNTAVALTGDAYDMSLTLLGVDSTGAVIGNGQGIGGVSIDPSTGNETRLTANSSLPVSIKSVYATGVAFGTYSDASGLEGLLDQSGKLTSITSPPGAEYQFVGSDAAGDVFGFNDYSGAAFEIIGGVVKTISAPGGGEYLNIYGVDASGDYVGNYGDSAGNNVEYVHTAAAGYVALTGPSGSQNNSVYGIDADGDVFGQYVSDGNDYTYLYRNGAYTIVNAPASVSLVGADAAGDIVGNLTDAGDNYTVAFIQAAGATAGTYFTGPAGATKTTITGINAGGDIVGSFVDGSGVTHGFRDHAGTFTTVDGPNATSTVVTAIDDAGDIAGTYTDASGLAHAFLNGPDFKGGLTREDLNADGRSDILFRNTSPSGFGDFGYLTTNATGARGTYTSLGGSNPAYSVAGEGDFTGAGHADVLFRNASTGDLGYVDPADDSYHSLGASNTAYSVVGVADFNGDGIDDILFRNANTGDFGYLATGGSNAGYKSLGASNAAYSVVGVGDVTGSGHADVLFRNASTGDLGYLDPANGSYQGLGGSNTSYSVVGTGDFDDAGHVDLLFRNGATGELGYLDPVGSSAGYHTLGGSGFSYDVAGVGDYNGDGTADILFRNASTGDLGYLTTSAGARGTYVSLGASNPNYAVT